MRYLLYLTAAAVCFATQSLAQDCPDLPDRTDERAALLETLAQSPNPVAGQAAADAVWQFWVTAPDERAQELLDSGMQDIRYGNFLRAEETLAELVAYCPAFPEGWNQRAFARFLREDFAGSLEDIDRTLELEPSHFGALSGKVMILVHQGRQQLARKALLDGLAVNPWLNERALLPGGIGKEI